MPRRVVVLSVDGLQAGMVSPYGNAWVRTPEFDRLAADAFVFDQAICAEPRVAAVFEALWPKAFSGRLLTDDAEAASIATGRFDAIETLEMPANVRDLAGEIEETQLAQFIARALDLLSASESTGVLWLHTRGMFGPWDAPYSLREQFADEEDPAPPDSPDRPEERFADDVDPDHSLGISHAYAGQVALLDTCLGLLLDAIEADAANNEALLIVIGLRGYPLGEHGRAGVCDAPLFNELVHVPLLVRLPDGAGKLERTSALVAHADIPGLIASWIGGQPSPVEQLIRGESASLREYVCLRSQHDRAVRTSAWLLRVPDGAPAELYVKPDDRWEVNDIADRCVDLLEPLNALLANPAETAAPLSAILARGLED